MEHVSQNQNKLYALTCLYGIPSAIYFVVSSSKGWKTENLIDECKQGVSYSVSELLERFKISQSIQLKDILLFGDPVPKNDQFIKPCQQTLSIQPNLRDTKLMREISSKQKILSMEDVLLKTSQKDYSNEIQEAKLKSKELNLKEVIAFQLCDSMTKQDKIDVKSTDGVVYLKDSYNIVIQRFTPIQTSFWKQLFSGIVAFAQFGFSLFGWVPLKGFNIGVKENVYAIQFGQQMTFLCDLAYDAKTQQLTIAKVKYISSLGQREIGKYLKKCLFRQDTKTVISALLFGSYIISSFYLFKKYRDGLARREYLKQQEPQPAELPKLKSTVSEIIQNPNESNVCIICSTKARSIIFTPCMHFVSCKACSDNMPQSTCPMCRVPIQSKVTVYVRNE